MSLFQFLLTLFAARPKGSFVQDGLATTRNKLEFSHPRLRALSAGLERAGNLLLVPDPQSIQAAALIVGEVSAQMKEMTAAEFEEDNQSELRSLHQQLKRIRDLLEGAMRVQWTILRRLMAVTQSYAPPGRLAQFKDRWPRVDVKV
jgi:hypothetical protein